MKALITFVALSLILLMVPASDAYVAGVISANGNAVSMSVSIDPTIHFVYLQPGKYTSHLSYSLENLTLLGFSATAISTASAIYQDLNSRILAANPQLFVSNMTESLSSAVVEKSGNANVTPYCNFSYLISNVLNLNSVTVNWLDILPEVYQAGYFRSLPGQVQAALNQTENFTNLDAGIGISSMNYRYLSGENMTELSYSQAHSLTLFQNSSISVYVNYSDMILLEVPGNVQIQGNQILFYSVAPVSAVDILAIAVLIATASMLIVLLLVRKRLWQP